MKKQNLNFGKIVKSIFIIALLSISTQNTFCQNNNIKGTIASGGKTSIDFERAINTSSSAMLGVNIFNRRDKNHFETEGIRISGEYRMYLTQRNKTLSGFYLAPNYSIGKHQVKYSKTTGSGLGLGLLFTSIDIIADGELDNPIPLRSPETITGEANLIAQSIGLKIGYQKRYKIINFDLGLNLRRNAIAGNTKGLQVSDGSYKKFNPDLVGNQPEIYLGIGFAF